jgi:hypothetical protein
MNNRKNTVIERCRLSVSVGEEILVNRRVNDVARIVYARNKGGAPMDRFSISVKELEDIPLLMPRILADNWPRSLRLAEFPNFCGAGDGFGELVVPETFYGLSMRHVCFIHDITHSLFDPTREHWHLSNQIMLLNALNTIRTRTCFKIVRFLRNRRAMLYYDAVETEFGFACFTRRPGGNQGEIDYDPTRDPTIINKLRLVGVYLND